jgi:signal transduction histidine kinase
MPALQDVTTLLEPLAAASGITITVRHAEGDEPLLVQADPDKLQQILLNVVSNAIKFSTHGGRITLESAPSPTDASLVEIRVHDTGVGMPASQLASIFEPFVQLGVPVHGGQRDGVGLGLSISRMLARGMGGDLRAESEVGAGSTLTLELPVA